MAFAVIFPGQGSQSVGMLADLATTSSDVKDTFAEASQLSGKDLWQLAQEGPKEVLGDTRVTQPLMFTSGVAVWRSLRTAGMPMPAAVAGHSLGEFSAMVAAGMLGFSDAFMLVSKRAELMAAAVPEGEGGMAALIGMEDEAVVKLCNSVSADRVSEAVNFNAPGQVAISGHLDALQQTIARAKEEGCRKAMMLPVSVPNHSSLMRQAGEELAEAIDSLDVQPPQIPLLQNSTAAVAEDLDAMLKRLKAHVYSPVYWTKTVEALRDQYAVTTMIEAGPGKVLTGLSRRIDRQLSTLPVDSADTMSAALEALAINSEAVNV